MESFLELLAESSKSANILLEKSLENKRKLVGRGQDEITRDVAYTFSDAQQAPSIAAQSETSQVAGYFQSLPLDPSDVLIEKENSPSFNNLTAMTARQPSLPKAALDVKVPLSGISRKVPTLQRLFAAPLAPSSLSNVVTAQDGQPETTSSYNMAESASKIYEYSSMMIRKNDGIVREQQDLVFEQTRRQIERLEMLQEMQVNSITRILQKQVEGSKKIEEIQQSTISAPQTAKESDRSPSTANIRKNDRSIPKSAALVAVQKNLKTAVKPGSRKANLRQATGVIKSSVIVADEIVDDSPLLPASTSTVDKDEESMPPAPQPTQNTKNNTNNIPLLFSEKEGRSISDESLILNAEPILSDDARDGKALIDQAIEKALQDRFDRVLEEGQKGNPLVQNVVADERRSTTVSLGPEFVKLAAQVDDIEKNVKHLVDAVEKQESKLSSSNTAIAQNQILASLQNSMIKSSSSDYSPLDKYLPVFSPPLFTNRALPTKFDYGGVDKEIRSAVNEIKDQQPIVVEDRAFVNASKTVPTWKETALRPVQKVAAKPVTGKSTRSVPKGPSPVVSGPSSTKKSTQKDRPKTPIELVIEDPLISVKGNALSILKTLLPLRDTAVGKKTTNINQKSKSQNPVLTRSSSPVRYEAAVLEKGSNDPLFIRRSSIRPESLAFFDHVARPYTFCRGSPAGIALPLDIGGDNVVSPPVVAAATGPVPVNIAVASQATQVSLENIANNVTQEREKENDSTHDVSMQHYMPQQEDVSSNISFSKIGISVKKEAAKVQPQQLRHFPGTNIFENSELSRFRGGNTDLSLEERLAEWIQREVLLNLIRDQPAFSSDEASNISSVLVQQQPISPVKANIAVDASFVIDPHHIINMATQTIHEMAVQTNPAEIPTQTSFEVEEELIHETPLDVSSMEPSISLPRPTLKQKMVRNEAQIEDTENSLTTQPSSLEDKSVVLPPMTPMESMSELHQTPQEAQAEVTELPPKRNLVERVTNWDLGEMVENVVGDVSMTELVPLIRKSIVEAHHEEMRRKAAELDAEMQALKKEAHVQSETVRDAAIEAQAAIRREKEQVHRNALELEDQVSAASRSSKKVVYIEDDRFVEKVLDVINVAAAVPIPAEIIAEGPVPDASESGNIASFEESSSSAIQSLSDMSSRSNNGDNPSLSLTISSLPTLSEGEILTQFYNSQASQGEVIQQRARMLVPAATLTNTNAPPSSGPPDAASSSDPTTSSGQLSSEGQVSILYPGAHKSNLNGDDSSILTTSALDVPSEINGVMHAYNQQTVPTSPTKEELTHNSTIDGIDLSISAIIDNPAHELPGPENGYNV